ncbi:UNVERIFIED_CONTAM: hldE [Trichonephila clavipes]
MTVLAGLNVVDWVVSFSEATPERLIKLLLPDVWVKASDYQIDHLPETKVIQEYLGQIKLLDFVDEFVTQELLFPEFKNKKRNLYDSCYRLYREHFN